MLVIDGAQGEGGGQILRTSLSLSMVMGVPVRIENIRAGRSKPGLLRQHLTCVKAAQAICDAEVKGAKTGSTKVSFTPGKIKAGEYKFAIGTAGSTVLVFQTILPALLLADAVSTVKFEGGTHNAFAPSFDFIELAYLPVLRRMGIVVDVNINRHGFYPQGGGQWQARIFPTQAIRRLELVESGDLLDSQAVATSAYIPEHVSARELNTVRKLCDWPVEKLHDRRVHARGSGNMLSLRLRYAQCMEVIDYAGKIGLSAEKVARLAVDAMQRFTNSGAVVGEHLADQLLLPMAMGKGGMFRTLRPSQHTLTNIEVIRQFTGKQYRLDELEKDTWQIIQAS